MTVTPRRAPRPSYATLPNDRAGTATVFDHLVERFPHVGAEVWDARLAAGDVTFDDGTPVRRTTPYRPGARLRYYRAVKREPEIPFTEEILHRDEHLVVVDKPPFLPVVPGGPYVRQCLLYRLQEATGLDDLAPLHRLDRDTAGLVAFSATPERRGLYGRLFMDGRVEKEYRAIARLEAAPAERTWEVENRLEPGEPWFRMRIAAGRPNARTRIELLDVADGRGLFRLLPFTGKKHQLRVHMASLGFAIENDRAYPELLPEAPPHPEQPLRLLARRLAFPDPLSGRSMCFESRRELALRG